MGVLPWLAFVVTMAITHGPEPRNLDGALVYFLFVAGPSALALLPARTRWLAWCVVLAMTTASIQAVRAMRGDDSGLAALYVLLVPYIAFWVAIVAAVVEFGVLAQVRRRRTDWRTMTEENTPHRQ